MGTRFELVLYGPHPPALRAAGEEALDEIGRLDAQLSLYEPTSEVAHLNARAAYESVRIEPGLFGLLARARQLWEETGGLFDITIAPLMRCWGLLGGKGRVPEPAELEAARAHVGMHLVELNSEHFTVRFARPGVMLDLGAIGKGYAIERAGDILKELGVTAALLHGGTSTVRAIGRPPDAPAWQVAIEGPPGTATQPWVRVPLVEESLSVSAVWGKSFHAHGTAYGHIMDPRTGRPAAGAVLAAVVLPSATETDALSTALLTAGIAGHDKLAGLRPGLRSLVAESAADGALRVAGQGLAPGAPAA
jgi:thiamine biosynthesis lipoprotein